MLVFMRTKTKKALKLFYFCMPDKNIIITKLQYTRLWSYLATIREAIGKLEIPQLTIFCILKQYVSGVHSLCSLYLPTNNGLATNAAKYFTFFKLCDIPEQHIHTWNK